MRRLKPAEGRYTFILPVLAYRRPRPHADYSTLAGASPVQNSILRSSLVSWLLVQTPTGPQEGRPMDDNAPRQRSG